MEYLVNIFPRAERDLADVYHEIYDQHSAAAREWYAGLNAAILTLSTRAEPMP
jgi:plasmid stabilization system protein ParE